MDKQLLQENVWAMLVRLFLVVKEQLMKKFKAMNECGIEVAETPSVMGETLIKVIKEKGLYEKCKTH